MNIFMKRILVHTVIIIVFSIIMFCKADASVLEDNIESLIKWCKDEGGLNGNPDGDSATDWYVFGASRYGYKADYGKYLKNLEEYVKENGLSNTKATEYHRMALVVLSCGGNPCSFAGMNLIEDGVYGRSKNNPLDVQGINGLIFGLIALDADEFSVPADSEYSRESIVEDIISNQLDDGGFALYGEESDADVTAMALQALSPYYREDKGIDVKDNVEMALDALSEMQLEDGGYESGGIANSESCAQVITALCSLGINPYKEKSFIKNGCSVPDALMKYQKKDGGFSHTQEGQSDWVSGGQALNAMVSVYRYENSMASLYDMSDNDTVKVNEDGKIIYYVVMAGLLCIVAAGVVIYGKIRKVKANP